MTGRDMDIDTGLRLFGAAQEALREALVALDTPDTQAEAKRALAAMGQVSLAAGEIRGMNGLPNPERINPRKGLFPGCIADLEESDPVHTPSHYLTGDIECIDAMVAAFGEERVRTYCEIAAFKYNWRLHHKGNPDQDRQKAIWYMRFAAGDDPRKDRQA